MRDEIPPTPAPSWPAPTGAAGAGLPSAWLDPVIIRRRINLLDLARAPGRPARHGAALVIIWAAVETILLAVARHVTCEILNTYDGPTITSQEELPMEIRELMDL